MRKVGLHIILLLCFSYLSKAQVMNGDECIAWAMQMVAEDKINEATNSLAKCAEQNPERIDISLSLARALAWNKEYDQAQEILSTVYAKEPENLEAKILEADLAFWSNSAKKSLQVVNEGLSIDPENEELLFRKARLSNDLEKRKSAWDNLEQLLNINPDHEGAQRLKKAMSTNSKPVVAGVNFISERFSKYFQSRFTCNAFVKVPTSKVIFIGNVNLTEINGHQGAQFELTAYPRLGKFGYMYLNAGVSRSPIYPRLRLGAELFKDFERVSFSAGFRYNQVNDDIRSTIYVASVSQYVRKLTWTYRLFVLPLEDDLVLSHVFDARVKTKRKDLLHLFVGLGNYTEFKPNLFQDELSYWEPRIFQSFGLDYNRNIDVITLKAGFIYTRQQFHQVPYPFIRKMTYTLGFEARF